MCMRTVRRDRKSTRLNSNHTIISYAVFCLKKHADGVHGDLMGVALVVAGPLGHRRRSPASGVSPVLSRILSVFVILIFWMCFFFFNDTATTEIYTLSLHDALPI